MDLIELDTFLAGYISRVATGRHLNEAEASRFNQLTIELEAVANSLQGLTAIYFRSLLSVAKVAAARSGVSTE